MKKAENHVISILSLSWVIFQLLLPRLLILNSITVRAIHLAFAISLVFLTQPFRKKGKLLSEKETIPIIDYFLAVISALAVLYLMFNWTAISQRSGLPTVLDLITGIILITLLLESARRIIGPALAIIALLFTIYAFLGPYMPAIFAFKGVSLTKYMNQIALSTEGIYGIPLDVSANTVFLFVLFGSILDKVGAGQFFNDLAIALLGKYKGGPAKAAVVSSGLTGIVSGSSIANVVTTGTFTIPLMKKVGYPAEIAAATEVAASTNGQLMPPIMGAAAFIIAEYLGISYLEVVKSAALPAVVSYFALFYITHLEASKLNMKGLPAADLPHLKTVLATGFHYFVPLLILLYELIYLRHTPSLAAYNAIIWLTAVTLLRRIIAARMAKRKLQPVLLEYINDLISGMKSGARNMLSVALATAAAGIVVGIVTMGIGSMIVQIVEVLSGGSFFLLLLITAIASLILGMGLPTTATYIVMASITVPIIIKLSVSFGANPIPAISAHLFCFYFGILADDTPPVGLAAYTAAAIAGSDPIKTGIQGFKYDLRTAVIPFMFVFNPDLVLYNISSIPLIIVIFLTAVIGTFAFTNAVQGWFIAKNRWYELPLFLLAALLLLYPNLLTDLGLQIKYSRYTIYVIGILIYLFTFMLQKYRLGVVVNQVSNE